MKTDYERLKIKEYDTWTLYLHSNQSYLGRTYLLLKRSKVEDFFCTSEEERKDFFVIGKQIKSALKKLFAPDKMNYSSLGNVFSKLHVHFIPRYKSPKIFNGRTFMDNRWGKNYSPYDHDFTINNNELEKIRKAISNSV